MPKNTTPNQQLAILLTITTAVLSAGTVIFHELEDWTWIQSLYFTVVTTTTVGYGDLHPTSDASRLFAIGYILFGVAVLVTAVTYIGAYLVNQRDEKIIEELEEELEESGEKIIEEIDKKLEE